MGTSARRRCSGTGPVLIDAYATLDHYAEHLAAIWEALPAERRGVFYGPAARPRARHRDPGRVVMVAGWRDAGDVAPSPIVYVEHGAGQTYTGDPRGVGAPSYAGAPGLERAILFVAPSERVADRWRDVYPDARAVAVGCPRIDRWTREPAGHGPARPTVAFTFHWECAMVPETRSAWRWYDAALPSVVADPRWDVIGHGHPRIYGVLARRWKQLGIRHSGHAADVFDTADVLVGDNTSALYEFAATGRPVVCLNAPWYRRDVDHGLRFWSHPPGVQCDRPEDLADVVAYAIGDPPAARAIRSAAVAHAYAAADGRAAERAAAAILEVL